MIPQRIQFIFNAVQSLFGDKITLNTKEVNKYLKSENKGCYSFKVIDAESKEPRDIIEISDVDIY